MHNKRIVLAVTGSIAAYKAADVASKLTQVGAVVDVLLTKAAQRFITPLTFQALTGRTVYTDMWKTESDGALPTHIAHVGIAEEADIMLIAPATANTLARLAHGLADDLLTVTALAARCPIVVSPAMDAGMYEQPATQQNVEILKSRGVEVIEPEIGRFASGLTGKGRLPETTKLISYVRRALAKNAPLRGKHIVVTAGGTREPIDPVRYITNRSSGKQGFALAQAALDAGADVTLITTVASLPEPFGCKVITVQTAKEMAEAVLAQVPTTDALLMAAAVSDFRPTVVSEQKVKKTAQNDAPIIVLAHNLDILLEVKQKRDETGFPKVVVGFAAESEKLLENATEKLERKGLDMIVANDILSTDAGFGTDTNRATLLLDDGSVQQLDLTTKTAISEKILEVVASRIASDDKT